MDDQFIINGRPFSLRQRACRVLALFTGWGLVSLVLQAAGCGTRGWMIIKIDGGVKYFGLWTVEYCTGGACIVQKTISEGKYLMAAGLSLVTIEEFKMEVSLALILFALALLLLACCSFCCESYNIKGGAYISACAALLSGILALVASLQMLCYYRVANAVFTNQQQEDESPLQIPYSAVLTGFGGVLALVPVLVMPFYLRPWRCEFDPRPVGPPSLIEQDTVVLHDPGSIDRDMSIQ